MQSLIGNAQAKSPLAELSMQSTVCFMLKELENFRYQEIAEIVKIEREEVKKSIAHARSVLLKKVA